jgi:hypothetical protein
VTVEEKRQSPRAKLSVPVQIQGPNFSCMGSSADVSLHGALVLCAVKSPPGSELTITRTDNQLTARFRVVWEEGSDKGLYKLGIESLDEQPAFWGEVAR